MGDNKPVGDYLDPTIGDSAPATPQTVNVEATVVPTDTKTAGEHVKSAASYVIPSTAVGVMLTTVIQYFFHLPADVATSVAGLLIIASNLVLVYIDKR